MKFLALLLFLAATPAQAQDYAPVKDWPKLEPGLTLGQVAGVAVNVQGQLLLFHRADKSWATAGAPLGEKIRDGWRRFFDIVGEDDFITDAPLLWLNPQDGGIAKKAGQKLFVRPHGLTVDRQGHLWVTDVRLHQVIELDGEGKELRRFGTYAQSGEDDTHFNQPTDVAILSDGRFVVSDGYGNDRLVMYAGDGTFIKSWGKKGDDAGEFDLPHGLAVDEHDQIYVADRGNARVQVFDREGALINIIEGPEVGRPWAVDIGADGLLYILDGGDQDDDYPRSGIVVATPEGQILSRFGAYGYGLGEMVWPHDIAVGPDGAIYVGDVHDSMRAHKFIPVRP